MSDFKVFIKFVDENEEIQEDYIGATFYNEEFSECDEWGNSYTEILTDIQQVERLCEDVSELTDLIAACLGYKALKILETRYEYD